MRNRLSSHIFVLLALIAVEVVGYFAIYRSGLIRGYETSWIGAARDLFLFFPLIVAAFWLSRTYRFKGSWVLYTAAIVLFSIVLLDQYRLFSDPELGTRQKYAASEDNAQ